MLDVLQKNVDANRHVFSPHTQITVEELNWGPGNYTHLNPPVDIIIASDVIYLSDVYDLLLETLEALSDKNTQIIIGHKHRFKHEKLFFKKIAKNLI